MNPRVDWHARFRQQARWTRDLRDYLYARAGLNAARRVLEVGCGTGVLTTELAGETPATVFGIDLDPSFLGRARRADPRPGYAQANAVRLPFPNGAFDAVLCHYLLLWAHNPLLVVAEMRRVTHPGGAVLALAEPDYGGRIDHPAGLAELGELQAEALRAQGADPWMGRQLAGIFHRAGLAAVETGLLGGQWGPSQPTLAWELEWRVLEADLAGRVDAARLAGLKALDEAAWRSGERVLFVPTFYAWGRVPEGN